MKFFYLDSMNDPGQGSFLLTELLNILESAAVQAGNFAHTAHAHCEPISMKKSVSSDALHIPYVQEKSAVSIVDIQAQYSILSYITCHFSHVREVGVFAEETDPSIKPLLKQFSSHAIFTPGHYTLLIDPIDGSRNYLNGSPYWSVLIAVLRGREVIGGVIYYPELGPCGLILRTMKGGGTWLNGVRVVLDSFPQIFSSTDPIRVSGSLSDTSLRKVFSNVPHYGSFTVAFLGLLASAMREPELYRLSGIPRSRAYIGEKIDVLDLGCCALAYAEAGGVLIDDTGNHISLMDYAVSRDGNIRIEKLFIMSSDLTYAISLIDHIIANKFHMS